MAPAPRPGRGPGGPRLMRLAGRVGLAALLVGVVAGGVLHALPDRIGRSRNQVSRRRAVQPGPRAARLHGSLMVCDLHADPLLWGRDLNRRGAWGHVDVPRLLEGRVALQVFSVVTQAPSRPSYERNDDRQDPIRWLALARGWPPATWTNRMQRALHQARRLEATAAASGGALAVIRTRAELDAHLERVAGGARATAGVLALEGAHALEDDPRGIDALHDAGFRIVGLAHFFDNAYAGSAHGIAKHGLTAAGRELVRRAEALGIVVDLAHASPRAVDDALALATRPMMVSHTGVRATCESPRNLDDAQLRAIAAAGGLIGIGVWPGAVCGEGADAVARAMRHAVGVAGAGHVALGSDFDGAVTAPFDAAGLAELTHALLQAGLSEDQVRGVMGANALRWLREQLR